MKVSIYTGYGALITNVVNEYQKAGVYSKRIKSEKMKGPCRAIYLIRLSYRDIRKRGLPSPLISNRQTLYLLQKLRQVRRAFYLIQNHRLAGGPIKAFWRCLVTKKILLSRLKVRSANCTTISKGFQ